MKIALEGDGVLVSVFPDRTFHLLLPLRERETAPPREAFWDDRKNKRTDHPWQEDPGRCPGFQGTGLPGTDLSVLDE